MASSERGIRKRVDAFKTLRIIFLRSDMTPASRRPCRTHWNKDAPEKAPKTIGLGSAGRRRNSARSGDVLTWQPKQRIPNGPGY